MQYIWCWRLLYSLHETKTSRPICVFSGLDRFSDGLGFALTCLADNFIHHCLLLIFPSLFFYENFTAIHNFFEPLIVGWVMTMTCGAITDGWTPIVVTDGWRVSGAGRLLTCRIGAHLGVKHDVLSFADPIWWSIPHADLGDTARPAHDDPSQRALRLDMPVTPSLPSSHVPRNSIFPRPAQWRRHQLTVLAMVRKRKRKFGDRRYEARSRGHSSPDSLAFELAKSPDDRADHCLVCSFLSSASTRYSFLQLSLDWDLRGCLETWK